MSQKLSHRTGNLKIGLHRSCNLLVAVIIALFCASNLPTLAGAKVRSAGSARPEATTTLTISPTPAAISGCQTIQVQIRVNDVVDLYGVDVRLSFNPAMLEVVDDLADPGVNIQPVATFLTDLWIAKNEANNLTGTIWYVATQLNPATPKSGSGVLATIHLKARAAGTSALTFTYSQLATINGADISASTINGSVQTSGAFAPGLSIARLNDSDVRLSWTAVSDADSYNLYRAATPASPYFTPIDPAYLNTTSLSYDDLSVLGDVDVQHYYTIKTVCNNGFKSENSNRVGEYDFALQNAGATNYSDVSMVFHNPALSVASELASYVGESVLRVVSYDPALQTARTYLVGFPFTDFALETGQFIFLATDSSAPSSFPMVGGVPEPGLSFSLASGDGVKFNLISLPLDQGSLSSAADVATSIGASVFRVARYDIELQQYQTYIPGFPFTDFPLVIGEPFLVQLNPGAPATWP